MRAIVTENGRPGHREPEAPSGPGPGTPRFLVRFGYDGSEYAGWARQPGLRTLEGEIHRALARMRTSDRARTVLLEVASRTDRGVNARGNAALFESTLEAGSLLRVLNGIAPDVFFTAARAVPPDFRARRAVRRTYRYFEPTRPVDLDGWRAAAEIFRGPVDVRSFGRGLRASGPVFRDVERVSLLSSGQSVVVEVVAPSFVWGMVRKVVAALREVGNGRLPLERLEQAVAGQARLTLPLAEPEPLVLWDVDFDLPWTDRWEGPNRHQTRWRLEQRAAWRTRGAVLEALAAGPGGSPER